MRSWWLPALVSSGLAVLSGCGGAFNPTYNLTCPGPLAAKASGAANLVYTSADPISVDWRVTPSTTGTFVQPTTVGPATNEDEPVTVGSQFNAAAEGTATISAVVDGDTVASCTVQVLPEGVEPVTLTLVVVGMGSVSGSAGNLACPGTCSASLVPETAVTLTPTPATNWDLTSVTGGCTDAGNGTYTVAPAVDTTCVFTFEDASAPSFVTIPAGPFSRGCDGANCSGDAPLTTVTFSQAYDIDLNEVTVSQYKACVDGGPCTEPLPGARAPPVTGARRARTTFPSTA